MTLRSENQDPYNGTAMALSIVPKMVQKRNVGN